MDDWIAFIGQVGVPTAIAAFVLVRLETRMVRLENAITELRIAVQRLIDKLPRVDR